MVVCWGLPRGQMETHGTGEDGDGRKRIPVCLSAAIGPMGRTVVTDELSETGILLQRFCGRVCRGERRGRYRTGVCTVAPRDRGKAEKPIRSLAIRAIGTLPVVPGSTATSLRRLGGTAFPSLRAHVLNPAGPAVHRDLAGATISKYSSCEPAIQACHKSSSCSFVSNTYWRNTLSILRR